MCVCVCVCVQKAAEVEKQNVAATQIQAVARGRSQRQRLAEEVMVRVGVWVERMMLGVGVIALVVIRLGEMYCVRDLVFDIALGSLWESFIFVFESVQCIVFLYTFHNVCIQFVCVACMYAYRPKPRRRLRSKMSQPRRSRRWREVAVSASVLLRRLVR